MLYATDGLCHCRIRRGRDGECLAPAKWIGETKNGFRCGFCDDCRQHGDEAPLYDKWWPPNPFWSNDRSDTRLAEIWERGYIAGRLIWKKET